MSIKNNIILMVTHVFHKGFSFSEYLYEQWILENTSFVIKHI